MKVAFCSNANALMKLLGTAIIGLALLCNSVSLYFSALVAPVKFSLSLPTSKGATRREGARNPHFSRLPITILTVNLTTFPKKQC